MEYLCKEPASLLPGSTIAELTQQLWEVEALLIAVLAVCTDAIVCETADGKLLSQTTEQARPALCKAS